MFDVWATFQEEATSLCLVDCLPSSFLVPFCRGISNRHFLFCGTAKYFKFFVVCTSVLIVHVACRVCSLALAAATVSSVTHLHFCDACVVKEHFLCDLCCVTHNRHQ